MYTNNTNIPVSLAVWLATDTYDHDERENTISVTTLLKPTKAIILGDRASRSTEFEPDDVANMVASRVGTAGHDAIERAWLQNHKQAMQLLGYPKRLIERTIINPTPQQVAEGCFPVYMEQRSERQVGKWIVTGKFDFVIDGQLRDFKFTSTYVAMSGCKDLDYMGQGSMYKWLNPDIITEDTIGMDLIFTDWSAMRAKVEAAKGYPQSRTAERLLPLASVEETDAWVTQKLNQLDALWDLPQSELPPCTDEELQREPTVYKYFSKATNKTASKNFTSELDARAHHASKNYAGEIRTVPGKVSGCRFCKAKDSCSQYADMLAKGLVK